MHGYVVSGVPLLADAYLTFGGVLELEEADALHSIDLYLIVFQLILHVLKHQPQLVITHIQELSQLRALTYTKSTHIDTRIGHFNSYFVEIDQFKILYR